MYDKMRQYLSGMVSLVYGICQDIGKGRVWPFIVYILSRAVTP